MGIKEFLKSRKLKIGTIATTITVLIIVAVVVVNVILNYIFTKYPLNVDLTEERIFQLSDVGAEYVSDLGEIEIIFLDELSGIEELFTANLTGYTGEYFTNLISNFQKHNPDLSVNSVNPTMQPKYYSDRGIVLDSETLAVVYNPANKRYKQITLDNLIDVDNASMTAELAFVEALVYVTREINSNVHVVTGHSESDSDILSEKIFKLNGYNIIETDLKTYGEFPEESTVMVINNPKTDFTEEEIRKLEEFIENDGKMSRTVYVFMDNSAGGLTVFYDWMSDYGLRPIDKYVHDTTNTYLVGMEPHIALLGTEDFALPSKKPLLTTMSRGLKSFDILETGEVKAVPILTTSDEGYLKDFDSDTGDYEEGDEKGKMVVGTISNRSNFIYEEQKTYVSKVVVVGSESVLGSTVMQNPTYANTEFVRSLINNTSKSEAIGITIYPVSLTPKQMDLKSSGNFHAIWITTIVVIPLIFLVLGIVVLVRRMHL